MIRSSFKNGVIWNDCSVVKSPADGHCLLHSVVSSMKSQLFPPLETNTSALLSLIKNEFKSHPERYIRFIPGNKMSSFYRDFDRYAYSRIYDSKSVDIIPNILCNVFDMKLILFTGQTGITDVYNIEDGVTSFHFVLQKCGEHYDGIAPIVPESLWLPGHAHIDNKDISKNVDINDCEDKKLPVMSDCVDCSDEPNDFLYDISSEIPWERYLWPVVVRAS